MNEPAKYSFPPIMWLGVGVLLLLSVTTATLWAQTPEESNPPNQVFLPLIDSHSKKVQIVDETIAQPDLAQEGVVIDDVNAQPAEPNVVHQDQVAARSADIELVAQASMLTVEQVERSVAFQEAFANYVDDLLTRYPEEISAVWTDTAPGQRGYIQFTGEVPATVATQLARRIEVSQRQPGASSVALTQENIILTGGGIFSMEAQARHAELAAAALVAHGYQNSVTFVNPVDQRLYVELQLPEEAAQPNKADLVDLVQSRVLANPALRGMAAREAVSKLLDLQVTVIRKAGPILTDDRTRGGNWVRDDGARECTSGWSVRSGSVSTGFITAGHCDGINQFEEPGVPLYNAPFIRQVWGTGGDVEYHTTPGHAVLAAFYADASTIRNVTGTRSTATMVGNSVCLYGRASNVRRCHIVQATGITITVSGVTVSNLARTATTSSIGGDSGGGWSFDNIAWGVNKGHDSSNRGYFTPIRQAQSALGVTVLTQ